MLELFFYFTFSFFAFRNEHARTMPEDQPVFQTAVKDQDPVPYGPEPSCFGPKGDQYCY